MSVIEIKDLWKGFRVRGKPVEAVNGIDLSIEEGEIFGFLRSKWSWQDDDLAPAGYLALA